MNAWDRDSERWCEGEGVSAIVANVAGSEASGPVLEAALEGSGIFTAAALDWLRVTLELTSIAGALDALPWHFLEGIVKV